MEKYFDLDELFVHSPKLEPQFDGFVMTIDNFYENAEDIYTWLKEQRYPLWKYNAERDSRNGKDYKDCRLVHKIGHPTRKYVGRMEQILDMCRRHWWLGQYSYDQVYEFNCFQAMDGLSTTLQHYPHVDSSLFTPDHHSTLNMIIYLDKEESGGTAVYEGDWISNDEQVNLLYPCSERFTLNRIIEHKFNRCVIFPGNRLHGAYVEDYTKYTGDNWRYTQVNFLHPQF